MFKKKTYVYFENENRSKLIFNLNKTARIRAKPCMFRLPFKIHSRFVFAFKICVRFKNKNEELKKNFHNLFF